MRTVLISIVALLGLAPALAQESANATDFERFVEEKAPLTVTIKFVLKMKGSFGEFENEDDATGVLISKSGLVLCSNSLVGGSPFMRRGDMTVTPTGIKVLFGTDTEGVDAEIIARDTDLDLAWIKIKEPKQSYPHIDLADSGPAPKLGARLYVVTRMGKYFDRVPVVREARVAGRTTKPRPLIIPDGLGGALGLPVFDAEGKFVGVPVYQQPSEDESDAGSGAAGVILPADAVRRATARAKAVLESEEEE